MTNVVYWLNLNNFIKENPTGDFRELPNYLLNKFKDDAVRQKKINEIFNSGKVIIYVLKYKLGDLAILEINKKVSPEVKIREIVKPYSEIIDSIEPKPEDKGYLPYEYAFSVILEYDDETE